MSKRSDPRGLWVKAYEALMRKPDLSRVAKMVYLELCMAARKESRMREDGAAVVTLSRKGTAGAALNGLLGGDNPGQEVAQALPRLLEHEMVTVEETDESRVLVVVNYRFWADQSPANKTKKTGRPKTANPAASSGHPVAIPSPSQGDPEKTVNDSDSLGRTDKSRVEESRSPLSPPCGGAGPSDRADELPVEGRTAAQRRALAVLNTPKARASIAARRAS